ncbi:MAG: MFS transporter [Candidatus Helarchaeota archaeon]
MVEKSSSGDISRTTMLKYGIGGLGIAMFSGLFGYTYNYYFYNYSSPAYDMGMILGYTFLIFAIWNTINDPIFGFISDRTRSRWGRRRPYIIFFVPVLTLGLFMIFFPFGSGFNYYFIWILLALFVYDTGYTFVGLTYASLLPELTFDLDKRAKTNTLSVIFMGIGTILTYIIGFLFLRSVPILQLTAILFAIIGSAALLFTGFTVKEKRQFMEVPALGAKDAVLKAFLNKSFLTFETFNFTYTLMYNIMQIALIQYAISVLEVSDFEGVILLAVFFLVSFLGFPLMIYLNRKLGTKTTVLLFTCVFACTITFTFFVSNFIAVLIIVAILGISYSAPALLNNLLIADIVDEDEVKTGRRREGMYFGGNALITKPAISVAAFIVGIFNTYFLFNPSFDVHSPKYIHADTALLGIRIVMGIVPALFLAIGLLFFLLYPLNKKRVEKLKKELEELHSKQQKNRIS